MASETQVKQYLAYWFQLGKKVLIRNGQQQLRPDPVLRGDRYSREFEQCWQDILCADSGDCYLESTDETIAELLTPAWDIILCARCPMPVPMRTAGMPPSACPCNDIPLWPNTEMPLPRSPVSTQDHLSSIRDRLLQSNAQNDEDKDNDSGKQPPALPKSILRLPICPTGLSHSSASLG